MYLASVLGYGWKVAFVKQYHSSCLCTRNGTSSTLLFRSPDIISNTGEHWEACFAKQSSVISLLSLYSTDRCLFCLQEREQKPLENQLCSISKSIDRRIDCAPCQ
jgi:hypothetical protein